MQPGDTEEEQWYPKLPDGYEEKTEHGMSGYGNSGYGMPGLHRDTECRVFTGIWNARTFTGIRNAGFFTRLRYARIFTRLRDAGIFTELRNAGFFTGIRNAGFFTGLWYAGIFTRLRNAGFFTEDTECQDLHQDTEGQNLHRDTVCRDLRQGTECQDLRRDTECQGLRQDMECRESLHLDMGYRETECQDTEIQDFRQVGNNKVVVHPRHHLQNTAPAYPSNQLYAVDPGAISGCLYRNTYVWLSRRNGFWFYPTYVGRTSVSGYRWNSRFRRWEYYGVDLNKIESFTCY